MKDKYNTGSLTINELLQVANRHRLKQDQYKDNEKKLEQLASIMSLGGRPHDTQQDSLLSEGIQDSAAGLSAVGNPYGANSADNPDQMIEDIEKDLIYSPKEAMHRMSIPMEYYDRVAKIMGEARMKAIKRAAGKK